MAFIELSSNLQGLKFSCCKESQNCAEGSPFNRSYQAMVEYKIYSESLLFVRNYLMLLGMLWLEFRHLTKPRVSAMPSLMNRWKGGIRSAERKGVKWTAW